METVVDILVIEPFQADRINAAWHAEKARLVAAGVNADPSRVRGIEIPLTSLITTLRGKYYVGPGVLTAPDLAYMRPQLQMLARQTVDMKRLRPDLEFDENGNQVG